MLRASSLGLYHNLRCIPPAPCQIFLHPAGRRLSASVRGKAEYVAVRPEFQVGCSTPSGYADAAAAAFQNPSPSVFGFESAGAGPSQRVRTAPPRRGKERKVLEGEGGLHGTGEGPQEYALLELAEMMEEEIDLRDALPQDAEATQAHHPPSDDDLPSSRRKLRQILARTWNPDRAWEAYQRLLAIAQQATTTTTTATATDFRPIPYVHLHRLVRVLATTHPRGRTVFFRLLAVLTYLHRAGGHTKLWEWNLLIDSAGQGLRRTRPEDFEIALDVYEDMIAGRGPGATFFNKKSSGSAGEEHEGEYAGEQPDGAARAASKSKPRPDIITYTTLLGIATRSRSKRAVRHASELLRASGLPPSLGCHMLMLQYFAAHGDLAGMRATLAKVREQGLALNVIAVNTCIWAFVTVKRLDVAGAIYRVLRHHVVPEPPDPDAEEEDSVQDVEEYLAARESLVVPKNMVPTPLTYHMLLQAYTYRGDFARSLEVFTDMLSLAPPPPVPPPARPKVPFVTKPSHATLAAFRSLFHGFVRHARAEPQHRHKHKQKQKQKQKSHQRSHRLFPDDAPCDADLDAWSARNLEALFAQFLGLRLDMRLGERLQFWIVMAFVKTTGGDTRRVRRVFQQLEERFGPCSGGRVLRLREKYVGAGHGHGHGGVHGGGGGAGAGAGRRRSDPQAGGEGSNISKPIK